MISRQLSDVTKDGALSLEEFNVAMHLVVLRRNNIALPDTLPSTLIPSSSSSIGTAPPASAPPPPQPPPHEQNSPSQKSVSSESHGMKPVSTKLHHS